MTKQDPWFPKDPEPGIYADKNGRIWRIEEDGYIRPLELSGVNGHSIAAQAEHGPFARLAPAEGEVTVPGL